MSLAGLDRVITWRRACLVGAVMLAVHAATYAWSLTTLRAGVDVFGQPLGGDFILFYGAGSLALHGAAATAFDPATLLAAERAVIAGVTPGLEWAYPPTFQFVVAALAALPYPAALALWLGVTFALYLLVIRGVSREPWALLLACAFPAVLANASAGQNGFLTTAILGGGLLLLDRRPWLAGAILGLLVYKPQFAVMLPLLMLATGRWRTIAGAACSGGVFIGLSWLAFGTQAWTAFLDTLPNVSAALAGGLLPLEKIPTVFAALIGLGAPRSLAYAGHAAIALPVAVLTIAAWRRPGPLALKAGLAVAATAIVTPYAFNYDLPLLAVPIAAAAEHAARRGAPGGVLAALVLAFFAPSVLTAVAKASHLQLMPVAILILFIAVLATLRRAEAEA